MTYCIDFFRKFKKDGNFCGLDRAQVSRINGYLDIVEQLMKQKIPEETVYTNFSVKAAGPLISAKDQTRTEGLNFVTAALKKGDRITEKEMQSTLNCCISSTTPTERKPKLPVETAPKKEPITLHPGIKKQDPSECWSPQPGSIPITDAPPQPSLAEQMGGKHFSSAYCLKIICKEYRKNDDGVGQKCCQVTGYIPGNMPQCALDMDEVTFAKYSKHNTRIEEPEPGIIPFIPPALKKPACQDRSTFECCPDLKSHVIIEKVRGRCCGVLGVPVNQIPKDECPIEKNMQAATKPGLLDQGDTVFSRGGAPLPKTETRWGSSQSMSREEKKRMFCTVIITTKQLLVLKEWMKHVDADDELIGLDEMFNEIERMMEAA